MQGLTVAKVTKATGRVAKGTDAHIMQCDDIPETHSNTVQHYSCISPAGADVVEKPVVGRAEQTLTCTSAAIAPDLADAMSVCNSLPAVINIPAAHLNASCLCEVYTASSAKFRACDCDFCAAINVNNPKSHCQLITNDCVAYCESWCSRVRKKRAIKRNDKGNKLNNVHSPLHPRDRSSSNNA